MYLSKLTIKIGGILNELKIIREVFASIWIVASISFVSAGISHVIIHYKQNSRVDVCVKDVDVCVKDVNVCVNGVKDVDICVDNDRSEDQSLYEFL